MRFRLLLLGLVCVASQVVAREPWTTSRIRGAPEAPKAYVAEQVFAGIPTDNVLEMVAADGRFYLLTRQGKVWSFASSGAAAIPELVLDLKALHPEHDSAYSLAFHPKWRENREVFVCYTYGQGVEDGSKLSRFRMTDTEPPKIISESEEVLLTWLSGGHNGSQLQFGPDGFLYFSTGDAKPPSPPDELNTGQENSDLLSCILRIDVDRRDEGRAYAVPRDNPFVGKPDVRPEIWAFGFRNPWRISFDPANGRLWCGDVGWELWEMIHLVKRGGNYGWSAMEASQPIKPETLSPLAPITPPVVAHPHTEAASITGGYVYHGKRLPELSGAYIYGDYETGKIWALWHDGDKITRHEEIADTPHRISTFGVDEAGELYYVHWGTPGAIYRLSRNPNAGKPSTFPRKLSETGLFSDVVKQAPAAGVAEFQVTEPMWQDGAEGRRFIGLPGDKKITTEIKRKKDGSVASSVVTWPADAVLAKTLSKGRKIETQVLHYDGETWNGYSYRWNQEGSDADLVGVNGEEDGAWRFHGRAECVRCHNAWSGYALGFQPQQLKAGNGAEFADEFFSEITKARLVSSKDDGAALEDRAKSWLHANCAHCHRRHGGGSVPLMVNAELGLAEMALLDEKPTRGDFGIAEARVVAAGEPTQSVLLYRLAMQGSGHMPMIGAREVDVKGLELLWQWIEGMPKGAAKASETEVSKAMREVHAIDTGTVAQAERQRLIEMGLASDHAHVRALYERFVPPEKRAVTLGASVDAQALLGLKADAARGAALLSMTGKGAACLACHFVNGTGRDFGPDLSKVGARLTKEQLLESMLAPSKVIAPEYLPYVVETRDGQSQAGFLVKRDADALTLKLATGQTQTWPKSNIKSQKPMPMSLMPEGLLQTLTAQEAADLLEYLGSLK
ncbi:MAG TPA: PQQ-dependent sugar dehydrogenase [Prosthecobacter sp.]|nr:PQQ-dependent sugar dehydrogenase [Prosthecobacter sp.]